MSDVLSAIRRLAADRLTFFCQGMEVGHFVDESYPTEDGVHEYMPYRCPGHLEMAVRCERRGEAPCYHLGTDPPTHFTVQWIDYGFLVLSDFSQGPLPDHFDLLVKWSSEDGDDG